MVSTDLLRNVSPVLEVLSDDQYLIAALVQMQSAHEEVESGLRYLIGAEANVAAQKHAEITQKIAEHIRNLKKLSATRIIKEASQLIQVVDANWGDKFTELASTIINRTRAFEEAYEEFITDYHRGDAFLLFGIASRLLQTIVVARTGIREVSAALVPTIGQGAVEGFAEFSLALSTNREFSMVVDKINAIGQMYEEIARILNVSTEDHPLIVRKIETGSLFIDLLGYPKIINLMVQMVERTAAWIYHNFTHEGRIAAFPTQVEPMERLLKLRAQLNEQGMDTSAMDEEIAKTSVMLSKNLRVLIAGEPRIRINTKTISIANEFEHKFLEESRQLSLPSPSGDDPQTAPNGIQA